MQGKKGRARLLFVGVRQIYKQSLPGSKRNEKGVAVNYEAWTTGNHTEEAGRLLQETGLEGNEGITEKKAADKLADMVKSYKNMRETAHGTEWGTEEAKHKQQELNSEVGSTVKDHINVMFLVKANEHLYLVYKTMR